MQQRNLIGLSLIFLFLLETTIFHWVIPLGWQEHKDISPHFVLIVILFIASYANRHFALVLGLLFGLLQDIVFYGYMIGPNAFAMGLTGYLTGLIFKRANTGFIFAIFIIILANLFFEFIIYGLYRLFKVIEAPFSWAFMYHILPSLLFNLLFALMIYIPVRYLIEKMEVQREEKEN